MAILNRPPSPNSNADYSNNFTYYGGKDFQGKMGKYSRNGNIPDDPRSFFVKFIPCTPKPAFSTALNASIGQGLGLKTFIGDREEGSKAFKIAYKNLLHMFSSGFDRPDNSLTNGISDPFKNDKITGLSKLGGSNYSEFSLLYDSDSSITEGAESMLKESMLGEMLKQFGAIGNAKTREMNWMSGMKNVRTSQGIHNALSSDIPLLGTSIDGMVKSLATATGFGDSYKKGQIGKTTEKILGDYPILNDVLGAALRGYDLSFPKVWAGSGFNRKYNINISLTSPYGDFTSIAKNVFIPFAHILALALPRQVGANSIDSPFLMQIEAPGSFNIPLGMITNINIKKGGNSNLWNYDGLAKSIQIQLEVVDLYEVLAVPYDLTTDLSDRTDPFNGKDQNTRSFIQTLVGVDNSNYNVSEDSTLPGTGSIFEKKINAYISNAFNFGPNVFSDIISGRALLNTVRDILA